MRPFILPLILIASSACLFSATTPAVEYPQHTIGGSQIRVLPKSASGHEYQLHIALPASYASNPGKRYPVLYHCDGYWDFPTIVTAFHNLIYDKVVPEFITVGFGYPGDNPDFGKLRGRDYVPTIGETKGEGAEFLDYLQHVIIPFVEREYRVDSSFRALGGSSLGGFFTLYAMYTKTELFQGYIAVSPATAIGKDWLFSLEEQFAKSGKPIKARLFMSGAGNEWPNFLAAIKRFDERLSSRKYEGFSYLFRLVDGERHAGTKSEGYCRGMRFVFEPLAPETGPAKD